MPSPPSNPEAGAGQGARPILEIADVSKIYGPVKALRNVSLTVNPGEWLAIMGPSGSGKTTLMNIIGCLDSPSLGRVVLDGQSLDSLSASELTTIRRECIGLIFQQFHLIGYLTALENVMVAQYYHSLVDEAEALEALERVGLGDRARHLPRQLSGGEQQRVCIARALINHPKLLLADEPTGNLDETNEGLVMDILHGLHRRGGTIIVVTHSPEVAAHAERTVVLEHGRVASDRLAGQAAAPAASEGPEIPAAAEGPEGPEAAASAAGGRPEDPSGGEAASGGPDAKSAVPA